jgi:carbonic anhydrase
MQNIIQGIQKFRAQVFLPRRERFEQLALKQQTPQALFITCSDSRIDPCLITQTEPGELFILRTVGNIIPPYRNDTCGEAATIEYAVGVLDIRNIILCGHTHCGAIKHLLDLKNIGDLPAVAARFAHAEATRRIVKDKYPHLGNGQLEAVAVQENVLVQVNNLRTHPRVAASLARGDLHLYAWVYALESGEVLAYDPAGGSFAPLAEEAPVPVPSTARLVASLQTV